MGLAPALPHALSGIQGPLSTPARGRGPFRAAWLLALALAAGAFFAAPAAADVLTESSQAILVTAKSWDSRRGEMRLFERAPGKPWKQRGKAVTVELGKNGLGWGRGLADNGQGDGPTKREGDGKAPAGVFALGRAFGYAPEGSRRLKTGYIQVTPGHECVDDPASARYNSVLDASGIDNRDWRSFEVMRRRDRQYELGVIVEHNTAPAVPGAGSCIFLHVREAAGAYTSGCTAMPLPELERVAAWLDASRKPVLVQLPVGEMREFAGRYGTPAY